MSDLTDRTTIGFGFRSSREDDGPDRLVEDVVDALLCQSGTFQIPVTSVTSVTLKITKEISELT
jgi:hypothetical protein